MVYLSDSKVLQGRSWWSVDGLIDLFWAAINFCVLFLQTLISPGASKDGNKRVTDYRRSGGRADRGRKLGRVGGGGGGSSPSPPPMGGG